MKGVLSVNLPLILKWIEVIMQSLRGSFAEIDLEALQSNLSKIIQFCGTPGFVCPMIKANAYGHGDLQVGRALQDQGLQHLGVALVEEALDLRAAGITDPNILTFSTIGPQSVKSIIDASITPVVSSLVDLELLKDAVPVSSKLPVHLKIDTGMHRMGLPIDQLERAVEFFNGQTRLTLEGLCTHLSDAEDIGNLEGESFKQLNLFRRAWDFVQSLNPKFAHAYNSSGALGLHAHKHLEEWSAFTGFGIRPGIGMYGAVPESDSTLTQSQIESLNLVGAMTLTSVIGHIHTIESGESVSYGSKWTAQRDSVVATIPLGYADGIHRVSSGKGFVTHKELRAQQVGTVCMDYFIIDITDWPVSKQKVGLPITIFGGRPGACSASEWAGWGNTISYEVFTSVSSRVPRKYLPRS